MLRGREAEYLMAICSDELDTAQLFLKWGKDWGVGLYAKKVLMFNVFNNCIGSSISMALLRLVCA